MFTTLNQSLAFHQSPEAFISRQLQELSAKNPNSLPSTTGGANITRASILNRQVHVVSSYQICSDILNSDSDQGSGSVKAMSTNTRSSRLFSAGPAYRELMKDWFGEDSILLEDGSVHAQHKEAWRAQIASLHTDLEPQLRETIRAFIACKFQPGKRVDLYETLKTLAWQLLLGAFLGPDSDSNSDSSKTYAEVEALQELLLRGQFSLFPISLNTFFYQSPRSRGLRARAQLQHLFSTRIRDQTACPLLRKGDVDRDDIAKHSLLFTSSIANKAVASLMTASLMNVFLMQGGDLVRLLRGQVGEGRKRVLRSVLRETERLSPPVVGVMRRVEEGVVLNYGAGEVGEGHVASKWHDVWMYFVGASRDESVFEEAQTFRFDRFIADDAAAPQGFAFGDGGKTCLGRDIARLMVSIVVEEMLDADFELDGNPQSEGVQAWLGWKATRGAEAFARDLKQLPCQRPRRPVRRKRICARGFAQFLGHLTNESIIPKVLPQQEQAKTTVILFTLAVSQHIPSIETIVVHRGLILSSGILQNVDLSILGDAAKESKEKDESFEKEQEKTLQQGRATTLVACLDPGVKSGAFLRDCVEQTGDFEEFRQGWGKSEVVVGVD